MLLLRLVGFGEMAAAPDSGPAGTSQTEIDGDSRFPYRLNSKIVFSRPDSKGNVLIQNPETNKYLLNVTITMEGEKEPLYNTGLLTPGASVPSAKLGPAGQKLENGVYECTAIVSAIDPDTQAKVASEEKPVTIYIGEKPN